MRLRNCLLTVLLLSGFVFGQGSIYSSGGPSVSSSGVPIFSLVTVCTFGATGGFGVPCSPQATVYPSGDVALTPPVLTQPFPTDNQGNYAFACTPGQYKVQLNVNGVLSQLYPVNCGGAGTGGSVNAVNGTVNQIVSSGGTTPVLSLASPLLLPGPVSTPGVATLGSEIVSGTSSLTTVTAKSVEKIVYADQFAGADIGAQILAAQATLPNIFDASSGVTYPAGVISLEGYGGTSQTLTTPIVIFSPFIQLRGPGSGQLTLQWCGSGPGVDISTRHSGNGSVTQAGKFSGFTLQGCGTAGGVGMQYGDIVGGELDDLVIQGFTGAGSIGLLFNNQIMWTERTVMPRVWLANNTVNWEFENTNSGNPARSVSWGYSKFLDVTMNTYAGQTGMLLTGTVEIYHSVLNLMCNVVQPGAGPVVSLANGSVMTDNIVSFLFEGAGTFGVSNLAINGSNVATLISNLNPPVGAQVGFKNFNAGYLINGLEGTVLTTSPTSFTAMIPGAATYSSTAEAPLVAATGYESIRVDATSDLSGFGYADNNSGNLIPVYLGAPSAGGLGFHIGPIYRQGQQMLDGGYVPSWAGSGNSALLELITGVNNLWGFGMAENPSLPIFSPFVTMSSVAGNAFCINTLPGNTAENGMTSVSCTDSQGNISGKSFKGTGTGAAIASGVSSNTDLVGFCTFAAGTTCGPTAFVRVPAYVTHPECTFTPQFDIGSGVRLWATYTGVASFTMNSSASLTGSVSYHCIGKN